MVDEIGNLISTLFQRQNSNIDRNCIFNPFQRLSNVWEIVSDVDSKLNKRRFARWDDAKMPPELVVPSLA
jgi:hypothetical protein